MAVMTSQFAPTNPSVAFYAGSVLAEEGGARFVGAPSNKASLFPDLKREPGQGKSEREDPRGGRGEEGCMLCAKRSRLGEKARALGLSHGKRPLAGHELSGGRRPVWFPSYLR